MGLGCMFAGEARGVGNERVRWPWRYSASNSLFRGCEQCSVRYWIPCVLVKFGEEREAWMISIGSSTLSGSWALG